MENVYDMAKVFRNEGISPKHSPEFTIIEFMCAYSDYNDVATVTEEMFRDVAQKALGRTVIKRNGEEIRQEASAGEHAAEAGQGITQDWGGDRSGLAEEA